MILHVKKTERFTVLGNDLLRDARLSWEARGMLACLLSFPPDWKLNVSHLVKSGGVSEDGRSRAGREKTYRIIKELKAAGYIVGNPHRKGDGSFSGYDYCVYESPQPVDKNVGNSDETPEEEPFTGFPDAVEPDAANAEAYEELTLTKDYTPRVKGKAAKKKDSVVNDIRTIFAAFGATYYHDGREARACSELKERYLADPKKFSQMILTYRGMRNTDKFFKDKPFAPSALATFWNTIEVQCKAPSDAPKREGPTTEDIQRQQIQGMKTEMDEAGWAYDSSLDSFVREAYSDFLHDKAKKEAGL